MKQSGRNTIGKGLLLNYTKDSGSSSVGELPRFVLS